MKEFYVIVQEQITPVYNYNIGYSQSQCCLYVAVASIFRKFLLIYFLPLGKPAAEKNLNLHRKWNGRFMPHPFIIFIGQLSACMYLPVLIF